MGEIVCIVDELRDYLADDAEQRHTVLIGPQAITEDIDGHK